MGQLLIRSIRKSNGDIYVKFDDIIKLLHNDIANLTDDEIALKTYINDSIEHWERYQRKIKYK